jgi:hypothetical protein
MAKWPRGQAIRDDSQGAPVAAPLNSVGAFFGTNSLSGTSGCARLCVAEKSLATAPRKPQRRKTFSPHRSFLELPEGEDSLRRTNGRRGYLESGSRGARRLKGTG